MLLLRNATVYTSTEVLKQHTIVIDQDKIIDICNDSALSKSIIDNNNNNCIDLHSLNISAGFIDLQLNGCGGVNLNQSINIETLKTMHHTNLKSGCTSFLPTLITSADDDIKQSIELATKCLKLPQTHMLGLHLEGPYISSAKKGIHPEQFIRKSTQEMIDLFCQNASAIKILTLAPELADPEHIKQLTAAGIIVAAGHTNATYVQAKAGFTHGIKAVTHLFNAMSLITGREPGLVGAIYDSFFFATDKSSCPYVGIIADGFHVDYNNIRFAHSLMQDHLILVTDAVAPAGTDMTHFEFAGKTLFHKDGKCFDENGTLGGSALTMNQGIANCVHYAGIALEEALRMGSLYPAQALNKADHSQTIKLGRIAPNYQANLAIFDDQLNIKATVSDGFYQQHETY